MMEQRTKAKETISPMEYTDADGLHVMRACGHYVSGAVKPGQKKALCPNCMFLCRFQKIPVVYPDQLPEDMLVREAS